MACSLRYHRFWCMLQSSYCGLPLGIISLLFVYVSILPVLQDVYWRSASAPYAREAREADRFRRELLSVLRHEESAASGTASTSSGADASWFRVDARQLDVGSPLPLLVEGETVGFRWRDTPPDVSDEGTLAGPGPLELWLGRVVNESDWEAFCKALEQLLRRQWRSASVTVVSDSSDDALLRRIWLAKVVEPASRREMVQAWAVTAAYEGVPLFFFAQRAVRGDAVTAEAVVTESLYSQMDAALPSARLEQIERDFLCALAINNPLLLCALLIGWFFARELGFVVLCSALLAPISTMGFKAAELLGVPISVNFMMLLEFYGINTLLCIGAALAAAVVSRLCRGEQLAQEVRQAETAIIQRLGDQTELSELDKDLLDMARRPRRRCFLQACAGLFVLALHVPWIYALEAVCHSSTYNGTPQVVARLEQMTPAR
ncbi:hypothetical protein [uncultured Desulfovibrio sp.]|uniref:hypothetical protein n=1 Tax=uncultured Desulfovibrio sp. TaxID=167968 RepID=UPI002605F51E|nr:hypothetical protein [uncultured Desulfovibrio sp.]